MMGFVLNYLRNLASVATGKEPLRPLLFSYYVTHRCSLDCVYCCDGQGRPFKEDRVEELSTADACRLIGLLRHSADTLDITGGEPLVRTDLEILLDHARSIGFRTILNTKGIGLQNRAAILELLDVLVLSVDSLDASRLGALCGRADAASEVLDTLTWLSGIDVEKRPRLMIAVVATPDNLADVSKILRLAESRDYGFQISPQIVGTTIHPALRNNPAFTRLIDEVIAAKHRGVGVMGVGAYLRGIRDMAACACHPTLMPTIRPDGALYHPCLEKGETRTNVLTASGYEKAFAEARAQNPTTISCRGECHIFCHMALSMLQRCPLSALAELRAWGGNRC